MIFSSRSRARPNRSAIRAAAGWSACDHASTLRPAGIAAAASAVPTPCPRASGCTATSTNPPRRNANPTTLGG